MSTASSGTGKAGLLQVVRALPGGLHGAVGEHAEWRTPVRQEPEEIHGTRQSTDSLVVTVAEGNGSVHV